MIDSRGVTMAGAAVASAAAPTQVAGQQLGKDDFLRLLVTQLRNQDPLNPLDQNQFLSQTAQFTALEQLQNINKALGNLTATNASSGMTQAAGLIGKTLTFSGQDFVLNGSGPASLPFTLLGSAGQVQVQVLDQQGSVLRTLNVVPRQPGDYAASWNGQDSAGNQVLPGLYHYRVSVLSGSGASNALAVVNQGQMTGFQMRGGTLLYQVGGTVVRPEDVTDVQQ